MTRTGTGERVDLSVGSWIKIGIAAAAFAVAQWLSMTTGLSVIQTENAKQEVRIDNNERRITAQEQRLDKQRDEWIHTLENLRIELKQSRASQ